jgi:hypothetical protein
MTALPTNLDCPNRTARRVPNLSKSLKASKSFFQLIREKLARAKAKPRLLYPENDRHKGNEN